MYYVYIMTNQRNNVLYTGVTNDIVRRVAEHKSGEIKGFTSRYNLYKCVFVQSFNSVTDAIENEKRIKSWSRKKKFDLINSQNPEMKDLSF